VTASTLVIAHPLEFLNQSNNRGAKTGARKDTFNVYTQNILGIIHLLRILTMKNENLKTVYEQYWLHARHAENETWLFTRSYIIIMVAIFAVVSAAIPLKIKVGLTAFGAMLSLFGFFVVYTLRIAFIKFALMAELIAINEFQIKDEYRRFFPKGDNIFPNDKWVHLHDILAMFYSTLTGVMIYISINLYKETLLAIIPAVGTFAILATLHLGFIRPKINEISNELKNKCTKDSEEK